MSTRVIQNWAYYLAIFFGLISVFAVSQAQEPQSDSLLESAVAGIQTQLESMKTGDLRRHSDLLQKELMRGVRADGSPLDPCARAANLATLLMAADEIEHRENAAGRDTSEPAENGPGDLATHGSAAGLAEATRSKFDQMNNILGSIEFGSVEQSNNVADDRFHWIEDYNREVDECQSHAPLCAEPPIPSNATLPQGGMPQPSELCTQPYDPELVWMIVEMAIEEASNSGEPWFAHAGNMYVNQVLRERNAETVTNLNCAAAGHFFTAAVLSQMAGYGAAIAFVEAYDQLKNAGLDVRLKDLPASPPDPRVKRWAYAGAHAGRCMRTEMAEPPSFEGLPDFLRGSSDR